MPLTDLELYAKLAPKVVLADGTRPLMGPCPVPLQDHELCHLCHDSGEYPRLDERDGQPQVPLDLLLDALCEHYTPSVRSVDHPDDFEARLIPHEISHKTIKRHAHESIRAVLLAGCAAYGLEVADA